MKKYTLGILDEQESEAEVIEQCFEDTFNIVKITTLDSIEQLIDIIKEEKINVISIDYKLKDHNSDIPYNGDYFFNELIDRFGSFPAFVLTQDVGNVRTQSKKISPRFIVDKELIHTFIAGNNKEEREKFIEDLVFEIEVHEKKIQDDLEELEKYETILEAGDKLGDLENRYIELNNKISKSISGYSDIPLTYFTQATNNKLDQLISKTEELLKKIDN